uniref:Uncharacterized protein n=1 Tax=Aegilops tauschii subsp. strangulata TaxID=200361 RepID=A0A453KTT5_AEGTS
FPHVPESISIHYFLPHHHFPNMSIQIVATINQLKIINALYESSNHSKYNTNHRQGSKAAASIPDSVGAANPASACSSAWRASLKMRTFGRQVLCTSVHLRWKMVSCHNTGQQTQFSSSKRTALTSTTISLGCMVVFPLR